jgi:hypothetical protein
MGASICRDGPLVTTQSNPLTVRYLLHVHSGTVDAQQADAIAKSFDVRLPFTLAKSDRPHTEYEVLR